MHQKMLKKKGKKIEKEVIMFFFSMFETMINIAWLGSGILLIFLNLCLMV